MAKSTSSEPGVLTIEIIEEAAKVALENFGQPTVYPSARANALEYYHKEREQKCLKFMRYFHKGVMFQHVGSKVGWEVIETYKHSYTGEIRCRIKSLSQGSNVTKELTMEAYSDYRIISVPRAVAVLFDD